MSPRSSSTALTLLDEVEENIVDIDVSEEMERSFLEYAYSVIYSRALPDARDGLKPVQRRILFMMTRMGLKPDKGHVKSARVTGEVMGKLHPHGDSAIYDAMVRMAQDFSLRLPLIDGHGNFGSLDAGPAAPRYTEARLAPAATALTQTLDEEVVDFEPNYDNQFEQPVVLPAAFPNLLVNGASGIAVGMATNMAPHNLGEAIAAARHLLAHPQAQLEDIMAFIPGPDLPSGGVIVGLEGIREAYRTGRGSFTMRAQVRIEKVSPRRMGLVITELPYLVSPEKVIEKIKDAVSAKKLEGVSDVADLTDRHHGLHLVIEIKNGFNPEAVLAHLFRLTPLEENFGINNVALVDGQPRTLGLLELLRVYVDHRLDVVRRRSTFRLRKRQDRLHLVEGLLIALLDIDAVIAVIRNAETAEHACRDLMTQHRLSEAQATYILDLRLRQLTKLAQVDLEREQAQLKEQIAELEQILGSDSQLRELISAEMAEVSAAFGTGRRTVLLDNEQAHPTEGGKTITSVSTPMGNLSPVPLEVPDEPCWIALSATGLVGRTSGLTLPTDPRRHRHDAVTSLLSTSARSQVLVVTSLGRMARLPVVDVPLLPPGDGHLSAGTALADFLTLTDGEQLVALVPEDAVVALGTVDGIVKRVKPDYPRGQDAWEAISLKAGDAVMGAGAATDEDELVFVTAGAQLLRLSATTVRPQGRTASGMAGVKLAQGDTALSFGVIPAGTDGIAVVTVAGSVTANGQEHGSTVKISDFSQFPRKGRATGGVKAHRFLKGEERLLLSWVGPTPVHPSGQDGTARQLPGTAWGKRDASGVPLQEDVARLGRALSTSSTPKDGQSSDGQSTLL